MDSEIREIRLEDLIPFKYHSGATYEGGRLQQLMDSIESVGLMSPVIVRPIDNGKYEIICGHNRVRAVKALGHDSIRADIRYGLPDANALELYYDSNLNQQSFSDWNYSQRINAVIYIEKLIRKESRQGKRTDLETKAATDKGDGTCVQSRQKLRKTSKRTTTRDKMAQRFGISAATLSKYRRIIKLPDDLLQSIARLLDEKRITFEAAYTISNMRDTDIKILIEGINKYPDRKPDLDKLKELPKRTSGKLYPVSRQLILDMLLPFGHSNTITPARKLNS